MVSCGLLTLRWIFVNDTPNSSNKGGSPSYPSVEKAASQPVLSPPCSSMRPDTPGAPAKPEVKLLPKPPEEGPP